MTEWQLNAIRIYLWHRVFVDMYRQGRREAGDGGGGTWGAIPPPPPRGAASVYIGETGCSGNMGKLLQLHFLKIASQRQFRVSRIKKDVK